MKGISFALQKMSIFFLQVSSTIPSVATTLGASALQAFCTNTPTVREIGRCWGWVLRAALTALPGAESWMPAAHQELQGSEEEGEIFL